MATGREKPWQKIAWSEEIQQKIFRDWGFNFAFRKEYDCALQYCTKSLSFKDDDVETLHQRSIIKGDLGEAEEALKDALLAFSHEEKNHGVNVQICAALYDMNNFEDCKVEAAKKSRKFVGHKKEPFNWLLSVLEQNILDSLGKNLGPFFLKNQKYLAKIVQHYDKLKNVDTRPLWKILKEQEKCDVVSLLEDEEELLHPREVARRNLCFRVFRQVYFHKLWIDVEFLRSLKTNKTLLLPQTKRSTPILADIVKRKYDIVIKFLKMLEARSPLYTEKYKTCPNQELAAKLKEDHLFRLQHQTRRDTFNILDLFKQLRQKGKLDKLVKFVEHTMGDYVILKTKRVMPQKFEFMNEIYNILALAYLDKVFVPPDIMNVALSDRLNVLMGVPLEKDKDKFKKFVFGDKSTYQVPGAPDHENTASKKYFTRLNKRLLFAKYPIEKSYLLHEKAKTHMNQGEFELALSVANKSNEEANLCQNYAWMFLAVLMMCRTNVISKKLEATEKSLVRARLVAKRLNTPKITHFLDTCESINTMLIERKRKITG